MAQFETPHALDNEEIKELKENKDKLSDEMKERLKNTEQRNLFVNEYKNYLQRSQNEVSKDMVKKLFGNIFTLAKAEGVDINEDGSTPSKSTEAQIDPTSTSQVSTEELSNSQSEKFRESMGLQKNVEIKITDPIDIKAVYTDMSDYIHTDAFRWISDNTIDSQLNKVAMMNIFKAAGSSMKEELKKVDMPIITKDNFKDPTVQKQVEDAMQIVNQKVSSDMRTLIQTLIDQKSKEPGDHSKIINTLTPFLATLNQIPKQEFKSIIRDVQGWPALKEHANMIKKEREEMSNAPLDVNESPIQHFHITDIVVNKENKKELKPHRELATNIVDGLSIDKSTGYSNRVLDDKDGKTINITYDQNNPSFPGLTIRRSENTKNIPDSGWTSEMINKQYDSESVTIECIFDKAGKLVAPKSMRYQKGSRDLSQTYRSGQKDMYKKVEDFLKTTGSSIVDMQTDAAIVDAQL